MGSSAQDLESVKGHGRSCSDVKTDSCSLQRMFSPDLSGNFGKVVTKSPHCIVPIQSTFISSFQTPCFEQREVAACQINHRGANLPDYLKKKIIPLNMYLFCLLWVAGGCGDNVKMREYWKKKGKRPI